MTNKPIADRIRNSTKESRSNLTVGIWESVDLFDRRRLLYDDKSDLNMAYFGILSSSDNKKTAH